MRLNTVFIKELRDALRDRRTWMVAVTLALVAGPVVFTILVNVISSLEERADRREVFVAEMQRAPTLINSLQRSGAQVNAAPANYIEQLRSGKLQNAVIVPPADFETLLAAGEVVTVDLYFDESHDRAQPFVYTSRQLLEAFNKELGTQRLIARGVSPSLLTATDVQQKSLAPVQARGAQLLFILPWVALIMSAVGGMAVAIDVTAGERERGSLEPLLMNPVPIFTLVLGKWAVVMLYSVAIVVLTLSGFAISMQFISSDTLSALMQLQAREIAIFCLVLLPFAALMAALNMLVSTFGRSYKEAQTYTSYIAMAAQFAAIVPVLVNQRDALWQLFIPSVGQLTTLMKTLRGETVSPLDLLLPGAICSAGALLCLVVLARLLKQESIVFGQS